MILVHWRNIEKKNEKHFHLEILQPFLIIVSASHISLQYGLLSLPYLSFPYCHLLTIIHKEIIKNDYKIFLEPHSYHLA